MAPSHRRTRHRAAAGFAASVASAVVAAAVLAPYHHASRSPWLAAGAASVAKVAQCEGAASRSARHACVRAVVAHAGELRVAAAAAPLAH